MLLRFQDLKTPVVLEDAEALLPVLKQVVYGWRFAVETPSAPRVRDVSPSIRLVGVAGGYVRTSPWVEGDPVHLADPVDAVCDLLLDLERAFIAESGSLLALHAAAVEFPEGLCVFPSTHGSGKSTLVVALAAGGQQVFADDMLALEPPASNPNRDKSAVAEAFGVAPGFMPRLRLPLPDDLDAQIRGFINAHPGPASVHFQYVKLPENRLAPLGTRRPITRLVLLARESGATARLEAISDSTALKHVVLQSFGRAIPALEMLDHLHGLVRSADCRTLHYASAPDAVSLLQDAFS